MIAFASPAVDARCELKLLCAIQITGPIKEATAQLQRLPDARRLFTQRTSYAVPICAVCSITRGCSPLIMKMACLLQHRAARVTERHTDIYRSLTVAAPFGIFRAAASDRKLTSFSVPIDFRGLAALFIRGSVLEVGVRKCRRIGAII